jgi:hypothetical protein
VTRGHWSRLRAQGGGPRGGGTGSLKGPLRKIVRHRKVYTVVAMPMWIELLATEDEAAARAMQQSQRDNKRWEEVKVIESGWREVLECGHDQPPVQDLIGETNAVRRRCAKCKRGAPPDVTPLPT